MQFAISTLSIIQIYKSAMIEIFSFRVEDERNNSIVPPIANPKNRVFVSSPDGYWPTNRDVPDYDPSFSVARNQTQVLSEEA